MKDSSTGLVETSSNLSDGTTQSSACLNLRLLILPRANCTTMNPATVFVLPVEHREHGVAFGQDQQQGKITRFQLFQYH